MGVGASARCRRETPRARRSGPSGGPSARPVSRPGRPTGRAAIRQLRGAIDAPWRTVAPGEHRLSRRVSFLESRHAKDRRGHVRLHRLVLGGERVDRRGDHRTRDGRAPPRHTPRARTRPRRRRGRAGEELPRGLGEARSGRRPRRGSARRRARRRHARFDRDPRSADRAARRRLRAAPTATSSRALSGVLVSRRSRRPRHRGRPPSPGDPCSMLWIRFVTRKKSGFASITTQRASSPAPRV